MKATADQLLEHEILTHLEPLGLPILSEEFGEKDGRFESDYKFIVDPLDGTVNFVRGLGPAAVSIAFYKNNDPVFGVLGLYPSCSLAWGGKNLGAFIDGKPIQVSSISNPVQAVLCTGIPSRFQFNKKESSLLIKTISRYGKVRMLGAASMSLLQVAQGTAEVYTERGIMLWDVAAGLAIVEGAGGVFDVGPGENPNTLNVVASNGVMNING
ncbi:inositol monophosphatase/fructose-1,6-bisphosphatase family protein [Desulfocapsa sulfexigens DSM 10523]|uniref:Inositol monophosphatase/fructose-1,6-bisphosphatase family protein n=1 Tax=Desulfocapsa sulfexigens (strain DSM 10523 / SB164P1) TaxID=1167006 RepID=M1PBJ0_DESSD|nr:inositol monophosphatase [Desulfocapsa sulfexigens]AGF78982.1 inositol monophosphatase/fructose-1,6-bisphosphatase family protein [Desulfocapsa sulfexigens DSM 10523]